MSKTPRINIPQSVRKYVLQRNNYQCQSCGKKNTETTLNIDHIIALARGGSNYIPLNINNKQQQQWLHFFLISKVTITQNLYSTMSIILYS